MWIHPIRPNLCRAQWPRVGNNVDYRDIRFVYGAMWACGLNSIRYRGAMLWNEIPVELRNSHSKASFNTKVKIYFLCHNYTQ